MTYPYRRGKVCCPLLQRRVIFDIVLFCVTVLIWLWSESWITSKCVSVTQNWVCLHILHSHLVYKTPDEERLVLAGEVSIVRSKHPGQSHKIYKYNELSLNKKLWYLPRVILNLSMISLINSSLYLPEEVFTKIHDNLEYSHQY